MKEADPVNSAVKHKVMGRLKVQSMNVRNLNTKVLVVDAFLQQHAPDVLFLQEADIAEGVTIVFEGYNTFYSDFCCGKDNKARTVALVKASTGLTVLPPSRSSTLSPSRPRSPTAAHCSWSAPTDSFRTAKAAKATPSRKVS